jgi:hypothetical protein
MKLPSLFAAGLLVLFLAAPAQADEPILQPGVFIQDGAANLKVNLYSAPTWADWNNDGAKDLIVGQIYYGWVLLFLNQGTDLNPVFNRGTNIQSGGVDIAVSWG